MTETNGFTIIAHRGFSEKLPKNTFPAFDLAIGLGFHNLELDVQLTKDKIPVIIHDSNLLRTTGVNDLVSERKYNQIKFLGRQSTNLVLREKSTEYRGWRHYHQ